MHRMIDAIFQGGVLRPLKPLTGIAENRQVKLTVIVDEPTHPISEAIGILPTSDADEMKRIVQDEFEKVDPDEWK